MPPLILNGTTGVSGIDGSAGTPSYVGGDSDTGLWYPAANTLALSTSGSERLRIDSSGNVGVGVTPNTWGSGYKAIQLTDGVVLCEGGGNTYIGNNWFNDGTNKYIATGAAALYEQSGGVHAWYTAASGTGGTAVTFSERMRIDSSGNVGIGTSTPAKLLHLYNATSSVGATQLLLEGATNAYGAGISFQSRTSSGGTLVEMARITADGENSWNTTSSTQDAGLRFYTTLDGTNAERMRITSAGDLLLGATSNPNDRKLLVQGGISGTFMAQIQNSLSSGTPFGLRVNYGSLSPNNTSSAFFYCDDSTTLRAEIRSNGGLANYSGNNVNLSDEREKTNINLAGSYLDKICAIPVKTFNYIDQNREEDDGLTLGVIAQDVQAVAPELVTESNWGNEDNPKMRLSIYQTDLQYALMKCIQEQQAMIEELKAKVAALEK